MVHSEFSKTVTNHHELSLFKAVVLLIFLWNLWHIRILWWKERCI